MIIGDYYVNNFLVAGGFIVLIAAVGFFVGVPGFSDGGSQPDEDPVDDFDVKFNDSEGDDFNPGTSHLVNFVDEEGDPVPGADVTVNGRELGVTDDEGQVSFDIPQEPTVTVTAEVTEGDVSRRYEFEDGSIISSEKVNESPDSGDSSGEGFGNGDGEGDSDGSDRGSDDSSDDSNEGDGSGGDGSGEGSDDSSGEDYSEGSDDDSGSNGDSEDDTGTGDDSNQSDDGSQDEDNGDGSGGDGSGEGSDDSSGEDSSEGSDDDSGTGDSDEGDADDGSDDSSEQSEEELEAVLGSSDYTLLRGESFTFNASNSTGDINYFYWQFGDGSTAATNKPKASNIYYDTGDYEIELVAVGEDGSQEYTNASLEVLPPPIPEITIETPDDGLETNKTFLDYRVQFSNVSETTTYSIRINGAEKVSGGLEGGTDSIQRRVDNPSEIFSTSVRVYQGIEIFDSEVFTINATAAPPDPIFDFMYPRDGSSLGLESSTKNISFQYEIENSTWADQATFSVYNESEVLIDKSVSTSPGNYTENVSGMKRGVYNYSLEFSENQDSVSYVNTFQLGQNEPEYSIEVNEPQNNSEIGNESGRPQNVTLNLSYEADSDAVLKVEVNSSEKAGNNYTLDGEDFNITYEEGETVFNSSAEIGEGEGVQTIKKQFNVSAIYDWRAWLEVEGEVADDPTEPHKFNLTEDP